MTTPLPLLFVVLFTPAHADDKPAKPVLELKTYVVKDIDILLVDGAIDELLGESDVTIGKAKPPLSGEAQMPDITAPLWRKSFDDRTRTIILRGTAKHLSIADDVVAVMNRKEGQPVPATKAIRVFDLKHARADDVVHVLEGLEIEDLQRTKAGEKLLLATGSEDSLKSVAAIVKAIDVP